MAITPLILKEDFNGIDFPYLSKNLRGVDIDAYIIKAQQLDIRQTLGRAFYTDVLTNYIKGSADKYDKLINGDTYVCNGDTIDFDGFKYVVLYYTYARYVPHANITSTPFGMKNKTNEFSENPTTKFVQTEVDNARSAAQAHWEEVILYLRDKRDDFPLFKCISETRKGGANISAVGGRTVRVNREDSDLSIFERRRGIRF